MKERKTAFGTKEWSVASINCINGCSHNCRYCYARYNAVDRFHRMVADEWPVMRVRPHDVRRKYPRYDGTVMFPTTHDITPEVLSTCLTVMRSLLTAGNRILIVTKPHLDCIVTICKGFWNFKQNILFRFTIGADDDCILRYWESGAPSFDERLFSLEFAFDEGFETSVSIEPMLDATNIHRLLKTISPFVTDSIWIGKMNGLFSRVRIETDVDREEVKRISDNQSDENILAVYERLRHEPKVKWKESIKKVIGLEISTMAGEDK